MSGFCPVPVDTVVPTNYFAFEIGNLTRVTTSTYTTGYDGVRSLVNRSFFALAPVL